ncbi:TrkH family potassium uptake protein [Vagococcus zengguangii]|uniref:TrkH family potassium uptake protein n=1 Tax=Vagococcus zengguangii TaxID=2571750 RepID=A0A4D7CQC9_9ENTE|nr:potassium transporter TrkG [Vagococcus zengguangii]QCI86269.1 TrkH family potassium uptake protein [Vagococcus zengguangii]TLG79624.1 TrkH family potassium uptake protein [Vagococcus zengguangii]
MINKYLYIIRRQFDRFMANNVTSIQKIVIYYLGFTVFAFFLLKMPWFRNPGVHTSAFDDFFMAISTVSVTGLSTYNINEVFNHRGIVLLEILFQIGGLGIMMFLTFFFIFSKKKISLSQRQLIMTDMNQPKLSGIVKLIRISMSFLIKIQLIFGAIFAVHFYLNKSHVTISESIFFGLYQSISAATNSGFDVTGASIIPYKNDIFFLVCTMFLIMVGGIGFPVIMEIRERVLYKRKARQIPFRFSLFAKIAIFTFITLFIAGTIMIYLLERQHLFANMNEGQKWLNAMFYSVTTRNAGLQMHDLNEFQPATLLLFSVLMFIGCSPSSVGGGVRTTTVAILFLYMMSFIKSEENVNIFGRRISAEDVKKAVVVFNLSLTMCFLAIMLLSATESHSLLAIIVEVTSAFGTTGLSLGITDDLTLFGKIVIGILMFVGRVGMLYTLMMFLPKEKQDKAFLYPTEKIIIG